jgi:Family of unknown function (DUF6295)
MCTTIATTATVAGSAKGANGWFHVDKVFLGYDHPFHAQFEHAVSIDFVNEASSTNNRLAVELSRESARELVRQLLVVMDEADAYEDR